MGIKRTFSFTATTAGQTVFGPISISSEILMNVAINGTSQDQAGGDFTISDIYITLASGVTIGTKVSGALQI